MRLIDADALKEKLTELGWINNNPYNGDNMIEEIIDNAPTVELPVAIGIPIMRPKGEWIWEEEWLPSTTQHPAECQYAGWVCNQCHEFPTDDDKWEEMDEKPQFEYCPNCGADMRGEEDE